MAIIIEQGTKKWWLEADIVHQCEACDTTYRLEEGDEASFYGQPPVIVSICPVCGTKVQTERPEHTKPVKKSAEFLVPLIEIAEKP